jgi:DNA-binding NarL/FixJ family response regulator
MEENDPLRSVAPWDPPGRIPVPADSEKPTHEPIHDDVGGPTVSRGEEVAELHATGLSNDEIAMELGLSPHTIRWHLGRMRREG